MESFSFSRTPDSDLRPGFPELSLSDTSSGKRDAISYSSPAFLVVRGRGRRRRVGEDDTRVGRDGEEEENVQVIKDPATSLDLHKFAIITGLFT